MTESWQHNSRPLRITFFVIAALAIADRLVLLFQYGLRYTGTDDVVFWTVAADLSRFILREPFLYGQNYNIAVESLAAVPLLWLQVPMQVAMPIATAVLAIAPFAAWAFWYARRHEWWSATLFVAIPVLMPIEWGLITSMTRGFINGIAITALIPLCLGIKWPAWRSIAIGTTLAMAVAVNPSALLFGLPFAMAYSCKRGLQLRSILAMLAGAIPILLLWHAALSFYETHPERLLHGSLSDLVNFRPQELIPAALVRLDRHLQWICPAWWPNGHAILYLLVSVTVALFVSRKRAHATAILVAMSLVVLSLGFSKVSIGTDHILFPYSRMFLALPILLAWGAAAITWRAAIAYRAAPVLLFLVCVSFTWKASSVQDTIARELGKHRDLPVAAVAIGDLESDAAYVADLIRDHEFDILIPIWGEHAHRGLALSYAGPLIQEGFPSTVFVGYDRRYWLRASMREAVFTNLLFICGDDPRWDASAHRLPPFQLVPFPFGKARLIRGNTLSVTELIHRLDFHFDPPSAP